MRFPLAVILAVASSGCLASDDPASARILAPDAVFATGDGGSRREVKSWDPFCVTLFDQAACFRVEVRAVERHGVKETLISVRNLEGTVSVPGYRDPDYFVIEMLSLGGPGTYYPPNTGNVPLAMNLKGKVGGFQGPYEGLVFASGSPGGMSVLFSAFDGIRGCSTYSAMLITCPSLGFRGKVEFLFAVPSTSWSLADATLGVFVRFGTSAPLGFESFTCTEGQNQPEYNLTCGIVVP